MSRSVTLAHEKSQAVPPLKRRRQTHSRRRSQCVKKESKSTRVNFEGVSCAEELRNRETERLPRGSSSENAGLRPHRAQRSG